MSSYVYAIIGADHPLPVEGRSGVGAPAGRLRRVGAGELAAVVSDAPESLRGKRRDLVAHERLLEELCEHGSTLPMRFGIVADDDDSVRRVLESQHSEYTRLLSGLAGKVEVNVKATHHEQEVLRHLLAGSDQLRALNDELKSAGGGSYEQRLHFGEQVANALGPREEEDAASIVRELGRHATDQREGPKVQGCFLNASFLVNTDDLDGFRGTVEELNANGLVELNAHGPLPPYSFATTPEPA